MSPDPDGMFAGSGIGSLEHLDQAHLLAVEGHGDALLPPHSDGLGLVRGIPGPDAHAGLKKEGRQCHVLEITCLVGQTKEIGVSGVARLAGRLDRKGHGFAVIEHLLATRELCHELWVSPRGIHCQFRIQHVGCELEPHLVVAPAGGPVKQHPDVSIMKLR